MVKINEMNVDDDKPLFEPLPFDIAEDLMIFIILSKFSTATDRPIKICARSSAF